MFDLEEVCGKVERLDPLTFAQLIGEKSESVMNGIAAIVGSKEDATTLFTTLVLGAVIMVISFMQIRLMRGDSERAKRAAR